MSNHDDPSTPAPGVTRRRAVRTIAVGTTAVWAAPVVTSLGSSAFAGTPGSPSPAGTLTVTSDGRQRTYTNVAYTCNGGVITYSASGQTGNGTNDDGSETTFVSGTFEPRVGGPLTFRFQRGGLDQTGTGTVNTPGPDSFSFTAQGASAGTFTGVPACA